MNRTISARCRLLGAALAAVAVVLSAGTTRASNIHTNFVERWVTNTVEVQMQANRFVTEYHTNWVERVSTNVVDVYATNFLTRTLTNRLLVDLVQTNLVRAYKTNFQALNLTNWTTVLVFKTNWVNQPVTNVVEIEMASKAAGEPAQSKSSLSSPSHTSSPSESSAAVTLDPASDTLVIEAAHTARPANNNLFEVQLTVNWSAGHEVPVQVQQWRVEKDDRSILCFGQEREFKRALPVGTYNVVLRAQRDATSSVTQARGTLTITPREVLLAQKPAVRKSST